MGLPGFDGVMGHIWGACAHFQGHWHCLSIDGGFGSCDDCGRLCGPFLNWSWIDTPGHTWLCLFLLTVQRTLRLRDEIALGRSGEGGPVSTSVLASRTQVDGDGTRDTGLGAPSTTGSEVQAREARTCWNFPLLWLSHANATSPDPTSPRCIPKREQWAALGCLVIGDSESGA